MLDKRPHPGEFEQHILPMGLIEDHTFPDLPPNFNRYILRTVDIDALCSERRAYIYVKLCRVAIIGFIKEPRSDYWEGTKIHVHNGMVGEKGEYVLPEFLGKYLIERAIQVRTIHDDLSDRQWEIIERDMFKNLARTGESETFEAMNQDIELSGKDAFFKKTVDEDGNVIDS